MTVAMKNRLMNAAAAGGAIRKQPAQRRRSTIIALLVGADIGDCSDIR
jgi:hypothetical protein